ncbi:MAG: hypothetical protein QOG58_2268 [Caballeronia sp.]|nr:hypothetical protein [Caballeronia sp.]
MYQRRPNMTERIDATNRAAPAQFVCDQLQCTRFDAGVRNSERWNHDPLANHSHGFAYRMILKGWQKPR